MQSQQNGQLQQYQKELNNLAANIYDNPQPLDPYIRKYTSIYIEARAKSQQFFPILCEHNILELILLKNNKNINLSECTCLLYCINLILSNTKTTNQIVYYLSQHSLHKYLFNTNILKESSEFIEYYIQLLKTILIKLCECEHNKSFIKLFCNERYQSFPILQFSLILSTYEQNQLVKVTAQQCVLILIGLINQYTIFQPYLCEVGFMSMVTKLLVHADEHTFLENQQINFEEMEETSKYLVDLIYELRENQTALLLINNVICNMIVIRNIPKYWSQALKFIISFTTGLTLRIQENYNDLDQTIIDNLLIICTTHLRILSKLLTNIYISGSMMSTFISVHSDTMSDISSQVFLNPLSEYNSITEMLTGYPIKFQAQKLQGMVSPGRKDRSLGLSVRQQISINDDDFNMIKQTTEQYQKSKDFWKLKESYEKKVSNGKIGREFNKKQGIFGFFSKKMDWFKRVASLAGINLPKNKLIYHSFPQIINPQTALFIVQFTNLSILADQQIRIADFKYGQTLSTVEPSEVNRNFIRDQFLFDRQSISLLIILADQYSYFKKEALGGLSFKNFLFPEQYTIISKLSIPYYFYILEQMREYLSSSLSQVITANPRNKTLINDIDSIVLLCQLSQKIDVKVNKQIYKFKGSVKQFDKCYRSLVNEMKVINEYIQTCMYQGEIKDIIQQYWKLRSELFTQIIITQKDSLEGIKSSRKSNTEKKKGKKKIGHRDRVKNQLQVSISTIKQRRSKMISKIAKSPKNKEKQKIGETGLSQFFTRKMITFECIQRILSPKLKSLDQFFEQQWSLNGIPFDKEQEEQFSSVISSQGSLVTIQETIKEFTVHYFGKSECKLNFTKAYFPPKIIMSISYLNKVYLETELNYIAEIKRNQLDPKVLQIIPTKTSSSKNIEAIRTETQQQASKLIEKYNQCRQMQAAAFSNAILSYIGETYAAISNNGKQSKKNKITICQSPKLMSQGFEETPRG